jgi:hypothetical protein
MESPPGSSSLCTIAAQLPWLNISGRGNGAQYGQIMLSKVIFISLVNKKYIAYAKA